MLAILLSIHHPQVRMGEAVDVKVSVRNDCDHPVWIVGVLEGCETGIRYPHYRPEVWLGDELISEPGRPETRLVGPLRLSDFYRLEPGHSFDPTCHSFEHAYFPLLTFTNFLPKQVGVYKYLLKLRTGSEEPENWLGFFGQEVYREAVLYRVMRVPRLEIESNALEVEVI